MLCRLTGEVAATDIQREIYTSSGVKKISYAYDAWGNTTVAYHNGASASSLNNPFTYRGYYYDKDLGLYYLNSRYYDCNTGRFINADGQLNTASILGYNLFAYCENNPISFVDYDGDFALLAISATFSAAATAFVAAVVIVAVANVAAKAVVSVGKKVSAVVNAATDKSENVPSSVTEPKGTKEVDEKGNPVVKPGEIPTKEDGYIAPKSGPVKGKTSSGTVGWKDKNGNIWVPVPTGSSNAHSGGHWDVQSPKGGYTNVYPGGKTRGGKIPFPKLPIFFK